MFNEEQYQAECRELYNKICPIVAEQNPYTIASVLGHMIQELIYAQAESDQGPALKSIIKILSTKPVKND